MKFKVISIYHLCNKLFYKNEGSEASTIDQIRL